MPLLENRGIFILKRNPKEDLQEGKNVQTQINHSKPLRDQLNRQKYFRPNVRKKY